MSYNATYNRRGAKARRTTKPPAGGAPSADYHQREHQNSPENHNPRKKQEDNHNTTLQRPAHTWAETVRESLAKHQTIVPSKSQTYHTVGKDVGFIYPFVTQPHLLLTGRYSGSDDNKNDIVFRHIFHAGHAATRELLQRLRTEAHSAIRKRLGMNLLYTDSQGDTVTVVKTNRIMVNGPPQGTFGSSSPSPERQRQRMSSNEISITLETHRRNASSTTRAKYAQ